MGDLDERDRKELESAIALLKGYGASEVYLFGSMARGDMDIYSDWDLAVRGLPAGSFFSALAKLMKSLSRSIDLIDLDEDNRFSEYISSKKEFTRVA
jgi:predicted nucleotidyltransferase